MAWRQAIVKTNAGMLLIGNLGTNFGKIVIRIQTYSFKKMHLKMSSAKWHPFCRQWQLKFDIALSSDMTFILTKIV